MTEPLTDGGTGPIPVENLTDEIAIRLPDSTGTINCDSVGCPYHLSVCEDGCLDKPSLPTPSDDAGWNSNMDEAPKEAFVLVYGIGGCYVNRVDKLGNVRNRAGHIVNNVTHWMPLPPPPTVRKE